MIRNNTIFRRMAVVLMALFIVTGYSGMTESYAYAASKLTAKAPKVVNAGTTFKVKANKKAKWTVVKGKKVAKITGKKTGKTIKVKALKPGTFAVKAKAGKKTKKVTVKVIPALAVTPTTATVAVDEAVTLKSNNAVKWSVSDNTVIALSVSNSNSVTVKGLKEGTATVTAEDAKTAIKVSAKITVTKAVAKTATADEVTKIMNDTDDSTVLVDARPQEAYAGWALQGAKNGGHLKTADLYSARWLDCEYFSRNSTREKDLANFDKEFGLDPAKSYIVYDYGAANKEASKVADYFMKQGVKNVKVFDAKDMIDAGTDVVSYTNYDMFIPSEIVKDISDYKTGKDTELEPTTTAAISEADIDKVVLIDVSYGNVHESGYLADGHVPGAIHMNTNCYERPRMYVHEKKEKYGLEYSLIGLDEFRDDLCTEYGIDKDSIVIACSTDGRPLARLGYMLRSLGVKYYSMSGHYVAWNYNGYELDKKGIEEPKSVDSFGRSDIPYPEEIVWMDEVAEMIKANEYDPDNHTAGTLIGKKGYGGGTYSTYSYHDLMGGIPGGFMPQNIVSFENLDGTPTQKEIILASYEKNGIPTDKPIVHYCGDGWGAAQEAYDAQQNDLTNVKYWGQGTVVWTNQGMPFIAYDGKIYKYDKYSDSILNEAGETVKDSQIMKPE